MTYPKYIELLRGGLLFGIALIATLPGCSSIDLSESLRSGVSGILGAESPVPLTQAEVTGGLKEALRTGIRYSTSKASSSGGYLNDPELHIPIPPTLGEFPVHLRRLGLGSSVDKFELTLNRAAEEAARTAAPIFLDAVRQMTITDAWEILQGEDDAATAYLREHSGSELYATFLPEVTSALDTSGCTRVFKTLMRNFNRIPGMEEVSFDLDTYTTNAAVDGLFLLLAEEEEEIRENPAARTTDLLRRVFAPEAVQGD